MRTFIKVPGGKPQPRAPSKLKGSKVVSTVVNALPSTLTGSLLHKHSVSAPTQYCYCLQLFKLELKERKCGCGEIKVCVQRSPKPIDTNFLCTGADG